MNERSNSSNWILTFQWILACLLGFSAGIGLSLIVPKSIGEIPSSILFGLGAGLAQWIVLRKWFSVSAWWIVITAWGSTLGFAAADLIHRSQLGFGPPLVHVLLGLTILGAAIGLFQWQFLRRHFHKAGWWVLLCGAAWFVGGSITLVVRPQLIDIAKVIIYYAIVGLFTGVSTGVAFFFLKDRTRQLEDRKIGSSLLFVLSLALIVYAARTEHVGQNQTTWEVLPDLGPIPQCVNLPDLDCDGDEAHCAEVVPFEPVSGTGYSNYPINDESWGNQYRSYLRRDLRTLIQYASAKVACKTADWDYSPYQVIGLGDMSEADGSIPGTSTNSPGHPWGTHQDGNDIDVAYFQISRNSTWLDLGRRGAELDGNLLGTVCKFTRYGMNVYHCTDLPYLLDPWRTALFVAYLAEHPYLRVIGVDGQVGPVLDTALDQLAAAGWIDSTVREQIPLVYETVPQGWGWFEHHHHHLHISMDER